MATVRSPYLTCLVFKIILNVTISYNFYQYPVASCSSYCRWLTYCHFDLVPSSKLTSLWKIAIEIVDSSIEHGGSFNSFLIERLPEGNYTH